MKVYPDPQSNRSRLLLHTYLVRTNAADVRMPQLSVTTVTIDKRNKYRKKSQHLYDKRNGTP